ncbi:MAG TPA: hypothetical protein VHA09_00675 [Nitrososphaera sp.]|nr:hypothetical protein [Nitrososphaera sp.]
MESRYFAFTAIASMLIFGVVAASVAMAASVKPAYAQADNTWYLGKGVKPNMYVKYRIQDSLTNDGSPYTMTIYFKEQDSKGVWIAPAFVVDQGRVINGTLRLSDINLVRLGGSDVPDDMQPYLSGYQNSLTWLEAYANKLEPKSLSPQQWGNVAGTGAVAIGPTGTEKVTVQGGTFDTTVVSYKQGQSDSKIWVAKDFPYPVKAYTYASVTSPPAPMRFAFELLEYGTGQPPVPTSEVQAPTPPLSGLTETAAHKITLDWTPVSIEPGKETTFTLAFFDNKGNPINGVSYEFQVLSANGTSIEDRDNQLFDNAPTQKVTFSDTGSKTIHIRLASINGVDPGPIVETVDFHISVVPEFPATAVLVAAAVVGLVILMTRFKTNIGSMFGSGSGRNAF